MIFTCEQLLENKIELYFTDMKEKKMSVFFAYSQKDIKYLNKIRTDLIILERTLAIEIWCDGKILPGENWNKRILDKLYASKIILLLISQHFLASDYCYNEEMNRALELHKMGKTTVLPIILKDCCWQLAPFSNLEVIPEKGTPILDSKAWNNKREPLVQITKKIHEVIQQKLKEVSILNKNSSKLLERAIDFKSDENYDDAVKLLLKIIEIDKNSPEAFHELGLISIQMDQINLAKKYLHKAVELDNQNFEYFYDLAEVYNNEKKIEIAKKYYEISLNLYKSRKKK